MAESVGSLPDGSIPVGPTEPATKRGQSAVANSSAASRAMRAAAMFCSRVASASPHSSSRMRVDWNEFVIR
jgi:hypothetical protein